MITQNEYKVRFKARVKGLFGPSGEGVEVYEASTAKEAMKKCKEDWEGRIGVIDSDEVEFSIVDVERL
jgi:hypothetical protein